MADTVDPEIRSRIMASVKQRDTGPEVRLRKALHRLGYRYKLNVKSLPGSPDLVFPRYKAVIFVHGCFWHAHGCKYSSVPSTRTEFWEEKFRANRERDVRKVDQLVKAGWRVLVVWECTIKGKSTLQGGVAVTIADWLKNMDGAVTIQI